MESGLAESEVNRIAGHLLGTPASLSTINIGEDVIGKYHIIYSKSKKTNMKIYSRRPKIFIFSFSVF